MILRFLAALQDRYARFRYRKYQAHLPGPGYADEAVRAHLNAGDYRKYRRYVLAGVVVWMLFRRAAS